MMDKPEKKETTGWWKSEFQYFLDRKILSRDELAYLFGQIKNIIDYEKNQVHDDWEKHTKSLTEANAQLKEQVGKVIVKGRVNASEDVEVRIVSSIKGDGR